MRTVSPDARLSRNNQPTIDGAATKMITDAWTIEIRSDETWVCSCMKLAPLCRAPKSSAAGRTPQGLLRASSATAMASNPEPEADRRPLDQEPDHGHREQGQDEAEVQAAAGENDRQHRAGVCVRSARGRNVRREHQPWRVNEVARDQERNVVEHDRGDDLVCAEARLQRAGNPRIEGATQHASEQGQRNLDHRGKSVNAVGDENARQRPDVELAFRADVEQPSAESQREGKAQKDVRSRAEQGLGERGVVREGALEQGEVRLSRIYAGGEDRERSHQEAAEDRHQGDQDRGHGPPQRRPDHQAAPAISRPMRSRSASRASRTATTRPRYMTATRSDSDKTSSSSDETSSTARPRSRSPTSCRWMNSIDPTST